MDQTAFRQLLSTPRSDSARQDHSSSSSKQFGRTQKRATRDGSSNASNLLPRKVGESSNKQRDNGSSSSKEKVKAPAVNSTTGESYVDRAEARRLGKEEVNEYKDAETLRDDFERRFSEAETEDERQKLREEMNFLGGDAKHSALVKGLDYALLAQQKAKLNGRSGLKSHGDEDNDDDDDLEGAYGSVSIKPAELRENEEEKKPSKFRPIGESAKVKAIADEKIEEGAEYIWRDGKRMRKKKKKQATPSGPALEEATNSSISRGGNSKGLEVEAESKTDAAVKEIKRRRADLERAAMPPPRASLLRKAVAAPAIEAIVPDKKKAEMSGKGASIGEKSSAEGVMRRAEEEEDGDSSDGDSVDIFADAGRWKGLEEDDSEDEEGAKGEEAVSKVPLQSTSSLGKRNWFSSGPEVGEEDERETGPLPTELKNILDNAQGVQKEKEELTPVTMEDDESDDGDNEADPAKSQRLEGFSDSILGREGVRYMLEKQDDENGDRKRKRKRSKKGKTGGYASD
ncbi:hypothetical protein CBS101457_005458 [Exobasidium rhododendri]|nr:hypothetical protein CBS101457_005458 [Exobasidium rhododendri]